MKRHCWYGGQNKVCYRHAWHRYGVVWWTDCLITDDEWKTNFFSKRLLWLLLWFDITMSNQYWHSQLFVVFLVLWKQHQDMFKKHCEIISRITDVIKLLQFTGNGRQTCCFTFSMIKTLWWVMVKVITVILHNIALNSFLIFDHYRLYSYFTALNTKKKRRLFCWSLTP